MAQRVFDVHPERISTRELRPETIRLVESMTSTANNHMGVRGNFEEGYRGDSHPGTYLAGVWFPDKTRVGWWKNGYPPYFGKAINAMGFLAVDITVNDVAVDLFQGTYRDFSLALDLRNGVLTRSFVYRVGDVEVLLEFERFLSLAQPELSFQRIRATGVVGHCRVELVPRLNGDVHNLDANYGERFWDETHRGTEPLPTLSMRTKPNPFGTPRFTVTAAMHTAADGFDRQDRFAHPLNVGERFAAEIDPGQQRELTKTVAVVTNRDTAETGHRAATTALLVDAAARTFDEHRAAHSRRWEDRWSRAEVTIDGDDESQQGIQFSLFHLFATYYDPDDQLNVGPKGFTGEKYGGATYWDTEGYLVPLYLALAEPAVPRALLDYRHRQLPQARHNAAQQGLAGALFPMVTFDGTECHNEWEITFEEIHRNGAIAYAIDQYVRYTGDTDYLRGPGADALVEISRFWADRVHSSPRTGQYMIHGVTGPNEYENNVNNNWYTNYLAAWVLSLTADTADQCDPHRRATLGVTAAELAQWRHIAQNMYLPEDRALGIKVQHDTFLDKELRSVDTLDPAERPLAKHWSWDRILRSCFIKQADVLQGMYFFEDRFSREEIRRNFEFYEPMTVHESSLSAPVHAILAASLGQHDKAMELFGRSARLDLDNYNDDSEDGLHVTSMSGSWLVVAQGFGGMRITDGQLAFRPVCPSRWRGFRFTVGFRGSIVAVHVTTTTVTFLLKGGPGLSLNVADVRYRLDDRLVVPLSA